MSKERTVRWNQRNDPELEAYESKVDVHMMFVQGLPLEDGCEYHRDYVPLAFLREMSKAKQQFIVVSCVQKDGGFMPLRYAVRYVDYTGAVDGAVVGAKLEPGTRIRFVHEENKHVGTTYAVAIKPRSMVPDPADGFKPGPVFHWPGT